ncbi:type I-F CRISPR-associated protein Csy2 [Vibrio spartinae]|uniref:CRISPR-associated protein Csy2 n=1 Tax=Vibrio spartinae TaxID=1918945 RepID=A0A1N6M510_9VIBR|nr:type I-F CRISPR-associated protein Csy2 [Vibrio spartinae]SIO94543.1 CRISPR-associated protein Csy2 [Vibrio spartinae]
MKHYLLLKKIAVQNANAIAGLTYGFPAITNFLGFAHALSRQLSQQLAVNLGGVAVISHKNTVHARQPSGWGDYVFALTRNPLTQQGNTAPINEEGRMSMQISLLIEIEGISGGDRQTEQTLIDALKTRVPSMRLAGGQITHIEDYQLLTSAHQQQHALRRLMPGFVLIDRHDYLARHFARLQQQDPTLTLMDAWCDFATLKYRAIPREDEAHSASSETQQKAVWQYQPKPEPGYLVPIATGYCAISECYAPGKVAHVRDSSVPVAFAETAYSVGEWLSVHRLQEIQQGIWRYHHDDSWYLARGGLVAQMVIPQPDEYDNQAIVPQNLLD